MTTTEIPPGRPGNLTAEELVKLQEFWKATMKVAGAQAGDSVVSLGEDLKESAMLEDDEDADVISVANSKMDGSIKSKSKRRSMFGRKSRESTPKKSSIKSGSESAGASATESDKYGQTKEYFKALASNTPEQIRAALWSMTKADHPDALLLRFLRARKWDVDKALVMMVSTLHWRLHEIHIDDDVMFNGEEHLVGETESSDKATKKHANEVMSQFRRGKSFIHGLDREGRPMCFIRVRLHRIGEASEPALDRFTVYLIETARLMVVPPVDTAAIIFDMTGFSLANMDYAPIKFMIKVFEANYPESLGVVLVHKAPWIFQGIWRIIRGWLDPVVASKIHFTSNNTDLEGYIARDRIPKEMDGDENWEYSYPEPIPGENHRLKDTVTRDRLQKERDELAHQYEELTQDWVNGPADDKEIMAQRNAIAAKLRVNYWQMDPYIRARSLYDRIGMIREGGGLDFYGEYDDDDEEWEDALEYQPGQEAQHTATNGAATAPKVNGVK